MFDVKSFNLKSNNDRAVCLTRLGRYIMKTENPGQGAAVTWHGYATVADAKRAMEYSRVSGVLSLPQ